MHSADAIAASRVEISTGSATSVSNVTS